MKGSGKGSGGPIGLQATLMSQKSLQSKLDVPKKADLNKSGISAITGMSIMKDVLAESGAQKGIRLSSKEKEADLQSVAADSQAGITPG